MKSEVPVAEVYWVVVEPYIGTEELVAERSEALISCPVASEVAPAPPIELRQGSGGAAPSGVQGWNPCQGGRGAEPPGKFLTI